MFNRLSGRQQVPDLFEQVVADPVRVAAAERVFLSVFAATDSQPCSTVLDGSRGSLPEMKQEIGIHLRHFVDCRDDDGVMPAGSMDLPGRLEELEELLDHLLLTGSCDHSDHATASSA